VVGTVSYGAGQQTLTQYDRFKQYLEQTAKSNIQIEPAYNESKALERISSRSWSIVFAPPGLAAIAISQYRYKPLFPLKGDPNSRSVIVVRQDSSYTDLQSLNGTTFAIGQVGSATGYYFPIFHLYGLTLSELVVAPNPRSVLKAIAEGRAEAGGLSLDELETHRTQFPDQAFRVLFEDARNIPPGAVLISPTIDRNWEDFLRTIMSQTPPAIADEAGFSPTAVVPDYSSMLSVVQRVLSIFPADHTRDGSQLLAQRPVRIFPSGTPAPGGLLMIPSATF
jgi:phosphonate transport system substrate-binding protein